MAGHNQKFDHRQDMTEYGENLHQVEIGSDAKEIDCKRAVDSWYNEVNHYDYENGKSKNGKKTGHFTQLVWKTTSEIGCAQAMYTGSDMPKRTVLVCNYKKPGNVKTKYKENVSPSKSTCKF